MRGDQPRALTWRAIRRPGRRGWPKGPTARGPPGAAGTGSGAGSATAAATWAATAAGSQAWRGPLRAGAGRRCATRRPRFYEDAAGDLFRDPWAARDAYGAVVDDPPPVRDRALAAFARPRWTTGGETARLSGAPAAGAAARDAADVRQLRLVLRRHRRARRRAGDPDGRARAGSAGGPGRPGRRRGRCWTSLGRGEEQPPRGWEPAPTSSGGSRAIGSPSRTRSRARRWRTWSARRGWTSAGPSCCRRPRARRRRRAARGAASRGSATAAHVRSGAVEMMALHARRRARPAGWSRRSRASSSRWPTWTPRRGRRW